MSAAPPGPEASGPLFEIKGGSISLPVLKLLSCDVAAVAVQLGAKVRQAPEFFRHAPVAIDLHELPPEGEIPDFLQLVQALRTCGLVPVGVRGGGPALQGAAQEAELAVLADTKTDHAHPAPKPAPAPKAPPAPAPGSLPGKLIEQPVRSGQRIYAPGGDLVVLAPVSAGAEIMADGNIHVYNALRGRALAGVQGNLEARIFCMDLDAELIAIGGHYKISEHLDDSVRNKPVQIYFRDNSLIIEDL
ncbi:septum site-determining protein MinC [Methyloterricola oryzae]|uniref:septum site-determining protein MinC n=1 Tax=Methyloterricola oryzae TaxID=1495050 RepID=UPI0005EB9363|nr:septum site-determining protein MinC [Methyloterricola oryzae]